MIIYVKCERIDNIYDIKKKKKIWNNQSIVLWNLKNERNIYLNCILQTSIRKNFILYQYVV